jgi:uncharacterized protein
VKSKEVTGGLDEEQIRAVEKEYEYQRRLHHRKEAVIATIAGQGKLTPEVKSTSDWCEVRSDRIGYQ